MSNGVQLLRHETSLGFVASKNASLTTLMSAGCEHLFLWDDEVLCVLLASTKTGITKLKSDNDVLRSDNALQAMVITTQAFNFKRFNQIAENANRLNSLIDAGTEKTVIEYREILRREKTCNLPVPADVAGGLLKYAYHLHASAMHPDTGNTNAADDSAVAARSMTYC